MKYSLCILISIFALQSARALSPVEAQMRSFQVLQINSELNKVRSELMQLKGNKAALEKSLADSKKGTSIARTFALRSKQKKYEQSTAASQNDLQQLSIDIRSLQAKESHLISSLEKLKQTERKQGEFK